MSAKPLAEAIDPDWWSALGDDDRVALLQAFKFRTGVDLTAVDPAVAKTSGAPAAVWRRYMARQAQRSGASRQRRTS